MKWNVEAIILTLMFFSCLAVVFVFGKVGAAQQQSKPYSVYKTDGHGQQKCVYIFGITSTALTLFSDWAAGDGKNQWCPELKEQK